MFRRLTLAHFKSIRDEVSITLAPLTVLTGSNSSGKSTVLQSVLLLTQTIRHSSPDRQLVLNGPLCQLGEYRDILHAESQAEDIRIGLQITPLYTEQSAETSPQRMIRKARRPSLVSAELAFSDRPVIKNVGRNEGQTFPTVKTLSVVGYYDTGDQFEPVELSVRRHPWDAQRRAAREGYDAISTNAVNSLAWKVAGGPPTSRDVRGVVFDHWLPTGLTTRINIQEEFAKSVLGTLVERRVRAGNASDNWEMEHPLWDLIYEAAIRGAGVPSPPASDVRTVGSTRAWLSTLPVATQRRIASLLEQNGSRIVREFARATDPIPWLVQSELPAEIERSTVALRAELSTVRYLGPLRVQPAPIYPVATTLGSEDVGPSGEWTASVLDSYKSKVIEYVSPKPLPLRTRTVRTSSATLMQAVTEWMHYLGVADQVATTDRGSLGHELTVVTSTAGKSVPLTHVGVGVSQCLPVVVSLLLAGGGTMTLLEQPELHLHPAVQSRLGDFLLAMSISGRQCLVETHSEYLINRLRLRIAQGEADEIQDNVAILFASMEQGATTFDEVDVNPYGAITNWPRGFFDTSQDDIEALLAASVQKRSDSV